MDPTAPIEMEGSIKDKLGTASTKLPIYRIPMLIGTPGFPRRTRIHSMRQCVLPET